MQFDDILSRFSAEPEKPVVVSDGWGQGRATFGGLVAALLYQAMADRCPADRNLRSLAVSFVGPLAPDKDSQIGAQVMREGKAVSQMEARACQDDQTVALAIASFGAGRESAVRVDPRPAPEAPAPEDGTLLPYISGVTPAFTQHIELSWTFGGLPFSGKPGREMGGWMRFRDAPAQLELSPAHVIALVDAWPPALLPHLRQRVPASTLSWTLELMQPQPVLRGDDWLLYKAEIDQARDGYGQTTAGIWTRSGELVALSRQTVTVFG